MMRLAKLVLDWVFGGWWSKWLAGTAVVGGLVFGFAWDQRARGRDNAIVEINDKAARKVKEARKARDNVPDHGNAEWLRKHSCRDC